MENKELSRIIGNEELRIENEESTCATGSLSSDSSSSTFHHSFKEKFRFCPVCGSRAFETNSVKSKKCGDCGFEYFMNPSSANVAIIRNEKGELLVVRRKNDPAKGTLDLPGGFADAGENAEEGVIREVGEETGLQVTSVKYLFSHENLYLYSGLQIPTLDLFFQCEVENDATVHASDDAEDCQWVSPDDLRVEDFGLASIREGLRTYLSGLLKISK